MKPTGAISNYKALVDNYKSIKTYCENLSELDMFLSSWGLLGKKFRYGWDYHLSLCRPIIMKRNTPVKITWYKRDKDKSLKSIKNNKHTTIHSYHYQTILY